MQKINKPFTRLWIYAMAVNEKDIRTELKEIQTAGIGGIELQVLYPLFCDTVQNNNVDFFSPEYFERLELIVQIAEELDLIVDITLGSGWPFGGPFISKEMSPDIMLPYEFDLHGPINFNIDLTGVISGKIIKAILIPIAQSVPDFSKSIDVTNQVEKTFIGVWPWGEKVEELSIPDGHHKLYIYVNNEYRQQVGKAAPNMNGYVMSHSRAEVTETFLRNVADPIIEKLGKGRIRSFFCDSIELTGSNWTKIIIDEFKNKKGYDLSTYIPALWNDYGEISQKVRYDFYDVRSQLTIDNFFVKLSEWATKNNTLSRVQAHGTWGDIIKAYGVNQIPEGETFGFGDFLDTNIMHRRLAVSAAILYNRSIVSNESYTWLRKPRYIVNLEIMKRATDAIFLDGINHIINHGYAFTPNEFKQDGLPFYASTVISPHNTWWKHYPKLSNYIVNCQTLFQNNKIKTNILMYLPQNDVWANSSIGELHIGLEVEKLLGKAFIRSIDNAGYFTTFVNDEKILELTDNLDIGNSNFDLLILPNINAMNVEVYKHVEWLAQQGVNVIFLDNYPSRALSMTEENVEIQKITDSLQKSSIHVKSRDLLKLLLNDYPLDIKFNSQDNVGMIRYEGEETTLFIANIENKSGKFKLNFNEDRCFEIINPHNMETIKECYHVSQYHGQLAENDSCFIRFKHKLNNNHQLNDFSDKKCETVKLEGEVILNIARDTVKLDKFVAWNKLDDYKYYVGDGEYQITCDFENETYIDSIILENCFNEAEIYFNDQLIGTKWYKNSMKVGQSFNGTVVIKIRVTSTKLNKYLEERRKHETSITINESWPYFNDVIEERTNNMTLQWREFDEIDECISAGLDGPVLLKVLNL